MNIIKRDNKIEAFNIEKVYNAVYKATLDSKEGEDKELAQRIADGVLNLLKHRESDITVEEVQDIVEILLMTSERKDVAKKYILYREDRAEDRNSKWQMDELQQSIWCNKYQYNNENFDQWIERVSGGNKKVGKLIREKKFLFAGRILANRGLYKDGYKVTYSNCYVLPQPEDCIEGIFETAKQMARTFSYGGYVLN